MARSSSVKLSSALHGRRIFMQAPAPRFSEKWRRSAKPSPRTSRLEDVRGRFLMRRNCIARNG